MCNELNNNNMCGVSGPKMWAEGADYMLGYVHRHSMKIACMQPHMTGILREAGFLVP